MILKCLSSFVSPVFCNHDLCFQVLPNSRCLIDSLPCFGVPDFVTAFLSGCINKPGAAFFFKQTNFRIEKTLPV